MTSALASAVTAAAHTAHVLIVVIGFVVVASLLLASRSRRPASPSTHVNDNDRRVAALRSAAATGRLDTLTATATVTVPPPPTTAHAQPRAHAVTIVAIASVAAAVVHAGVAPEHFGERAVFGLFFVTASLLQLIWAVIALRAPSRSLWAIGAGANAAVIVLWLVTRTVGLPFSLLPQPERVGAWDVVATGCELIVVTGCLVLLAKERSCGGRSGWSATPSLPSHTC